MVDAALKAKWYYSDAFDAYDRLWYHFGRYEVSKGKADTYSIEGDNAELRPYCLRLINLPISPSPALYTCLKTTFPAFISSAISHAPRILRFPSSHPTCTTKSTAWAKISLAASMLT